MVVRTKVQQEVDELRYQILWCLLSMVGLQAGVPPRDTRVGQSSTPQLYCTTPGKKLRQARAYSTTLPPGTVNIPGYTLQYPRQRESTPSCLGPLFIWSLTVMVLLQFLVIPGLLRFPLGPRYFCNFLRTEPYSLNVQLL